MRIATILGTRPEIIRLSKVIPKLDKICDHVLIHTGQHYDVQLSHVFFEELNLRQPDICLESVQGVSFAHQVSHILFSIEKQLQKVEPDRVLILGDTDSGLSAFVAARMGIPVYHMEAGNRCYDDRVPEEINRRIIDQCSEVLMPYTERSRDNLLREGFAGERIFVIGNPIYEILAEQYSNITTLAELGVSSGGYFLVTAHRYENVSNRDRLSNIVRACSWLAEEYELPVIFSCHPRTRENIKRADIGSDVIKFHEPFGFKDFYTLERNAFCVLTDSGTVQEECCILGVRCVTLRDVTERMETIECGSNILSGADFSNILKCVELVLSQGINWEPPRDYVRPNVSDTVVKIIAGY